MTSVAGPVTVGPVVPGRSPARVVGALATSLALTAVAVTFSVGLVMGTSDAATQQPVPVPGATAASSCAPREVWSTTPGDANLPSPQPLSSPGFGVQK